MAKVLYVLQARMSSSRLPGKVLLPLGGFPSVVLAALRAGRDGTPVVVATSNEPSDEILVDILTRAGLKVVRGALEDVLTRFILATADMADDDIAVRLTADNVVPDSAFIGRVVARLKHSSDDYVGTASPQNGLPYGLSAEAFRIRALRQADRKATMDHDRADVTPWMVRNACATIYSEPVPDGLGAHVRCTIDTLDDYQAMARAVSAVSDAVACDSIEILKRLADAPGAPKFCIPFRIDGERAIGRLVLGTVQFGLDYGRVNAAGRPRRDNAREMIRTAIRHGVTDIDTARCYGEAEDIVGEALHGGWRSRVRLLTKVDPPSESAQLDAATSAAMIDAQVFASLRALQTDSLDVVMLREAWPLRRANACWDRLVQLRDKGLIGMLGLSAQSPEEALLALKDLEIGHIQLPYNILDHRWEEAGVPSVARRRKDCIIHARSIYLQGLLTAGRADDWPRIGGVEPAEIIARLDDAARGSGLPNRAALCLAYVRGRDWIDGIVIGMDNAEQLAINLARFNDAPLDAEHGTEIAASLPRVPEALLNPSNWTH
jgi:spore coat polysaccharide biosynthesis protein SpsF (cytidylyltransferase family)/aryl-alcohol dehydrogenase-like predicted oxidoreductase